MAKDMNELMVLRWRDYPELPGGAPCNHKNPYKGKMGAPRSERRGDDEVCGGRWRERGERKGEGEREYHVAGLEDGGSSHKPRNPGSLQKLTKQRKQISP